MAGVALHTNFALIDVDDVEVEIGRFESYDRDRHLELVRQHGTTHLFRRHRDALEAVALSPDAPRLGETLSRRSARRLGRLLPPLVEEALARMLSDSASKLAFLRRHPLKVMSLEPNNDLARQVFGRRVGEEFPVRARRGYLMEARSVVVRGRRRTVLVLDAHVYTAIDASIAELLESGIDVTGLYAQIEEPSRHHIVETERRTAGLIAHCDADGVHLAADRRDADVSCLRADSSYLEPSPAALARLLGHFVGTGAQDELWGQRSELASGAKRLDRIEALRKRLARSPIALLPGVSLRVGRWVASADLPSKDLPAPRFVVGPGSGRTVASTTGAFQHGPRHRPRLRPGAVRAAVICEEALEAEVKRFLQELIEGLGRHRGVGAAWGLPRIDCSFFLAGSPRATNYEQACREALDAAAPFDLVFVQSPEGTEDLRGEANPYLVAKAKFLAKGIPVQEFQPRTVRKPESQRQWALGGIALQVFAKLGGVPWLLEAPPAPPWEVVLGLGSAQLGTGKFGARERIVGLATAFSGDGTYWMTEASRAVAYEDYEAALGQTAVRALRRARTEMGWQPGDPVRLVVHSFKNYRGAHAVEVAFVHVVDFHPNLLFDSAGRTRIPPRGKVVRLSDHEALVTMLGPRDVRSSERGFPGPLLIRLDRASTFTNVDYLARQALAFAAQSWRDFKPTSTPVTILYPELIAKLLGRLGDLPTWDPDVVRGEVGATRWFL